MRREVRRRRGELAPCCRHQLHSVCEGCPEDQGVAQSSSPIDRESCPKEIASASITRTAAAIIMSTIRASKSKHLQFPTACL